MSSDVTQKLQVNVFKMTNTVFRHFASSVLQAFVSSSKTASAEVPHVIGSGKVYISLYFFCVTGNGLGTQVDLCNLNSDRKIHPHRLFFTRFLKVTFHLMNFHQKIHFTPYK